MTEGPEADGTADDAAADADRDADRPGRTDPDEESVESDAAEAADADEPVAEDAATDASEDAEIDRNADGDGTGTGNRQVAGATGGGSETVAVEDDAADDERAGDAGTAADDGIGEPADDGTDDATDDPAADGETDEPSTGDGAEPPADDVPPDVRTYDKFSKIDGGTYDRANEFLRDRTYVTAREWAIARLCADFRTETGVEMTKIGENLPELVPFMTDTYMPQAVNQARSSFEGKVRKSGATFLYGAMCDFFTAEELDDVMYEATEVAKFLLEVEGVELSVDEELEAEDRISEVMREVREHSAALRHDEMTCPECGHEMTVDED